MGGGQSNPGQAAAANANATAQAQQQAALAKQAQQQGQQLAVAPTAQAATAGANAGTYNAQQQQLYNALWGDPSGGAAPSGALGRIVSAGLPNVSSPTGPYALQYTNAAANSDQQTQQAIAAAKANALQRGFGTGAPAGFAQDQELQANLSNAANKGNLYQGATNASHQEALNNFWNATGAAGSQGTASGAGGVAQQGLQQGSTGQAINAQQTGTGEAVTSGQDASNTYGQLYGTAGAYHQSPVAAGITSGLGAAGSAAISCVCAGTSILLDSEKYKNVEDMKPGDRVRSRDGHHDEVLDIEVVPDVPCYLLATSGRQVLRASGEHTIERVGGGYVKVRDCADVKVHTRDGATVVTELSKIGNRTVYKVKLRYAHIYLSSGIWSLE